MAERDEQAASEVVSESSEVDFAATVEKLEQLVERLESGELSLEGSLAAFEQGVALTRDAQRRLDEAELRVRTLIERPDGSIDFAPFDAPAAEDESEQ
ncbi:exodeoxyribonuclease VII small subunit [Billgrantia kenyensis]|jgi:exodeoxyribonuclease VII small subunit|uniref:Exodeoxyribonuclease 7 small subunit n=1 Tax=Billgrantia kenyensis TaxID=321266 RepID=A0A7V9VYZ1_9GAMM|nr:exodeoxyribonuclease VII small subunit [Halomonas kenyensis]MBA2777982.1 exodeoxyribonuclease VII small subunit [Halomonas kenyensis]MCG6661453.1 exodeoxyribonuclease VII small subunit [Halomonas kenyensis]